MREEIRVFGQHVGAQSPFRVIMAGVSFCDDTYLISRPDYSYFVIEYVTGGEGILETGNQRYRLHAGDTYFLYPGKGHRYYCTGEIWNKLWVVMDGALEEAMVDSYLPRRPDVLRELDIRRGMEKLLALANDSTLSYEELCNRMSVEVHKILISAGDRTAEEAAELHKAVKNWIDERREGPLRLDELATAQNYSKNHIINVFRAAYGVTPYAYFQQQRLLAARELLLGTSLPVCEIARKLGFDSPQYLSRCFRKRFGVCPTKLRQGGHR